MNLEKIIGHDSNDEKKKSFVFKERNQGKKVINIHDIEEKNDKIHENIEAVYDRKMTYFDVSFIIKSLKQHFFFNNLSEEAL